MYIKFYGTPPVFYLKAAIPDNHLWIRSADHINEIIPVVIRGAVPSIYTYYL